MPKYKDEQGNEYELPTPEELEAKNKELEEARAALTVKEEELSKLKDKDTNFANLRKQKDEAEKLVEKLNKEVQGFEPKMEQFKKELFEGVLKDHYLETLKSLAGDDETLQKKIEAQYNRLSDPTTSKAEIEKKLRDAYLLANEKPSSPSYAFASSGGASVVKPKSDKKFTDEEKAFTKMMAASAGMNIKDEDFN